MAAPTTTSGGSRFALLKVEDSDEEKNDKRSSKKEQTKSKKTQQQLSAKAKSRQEDALSKELQNLAFGKALSAKARKQGNNQQKVQQPPTEEQWHRWQEQDKEVVEAAYEKDLHQALLLSKLEVQQQHHMEQQLRLQGELGSAEAGLGKEAKKGKHLKPKAMSLDEFSKTVDNEKQGRHDYAAGDMVDGSISYPAHGVPAPDETGFFEEVKEAAMVIRKKEQTQDEYSKQYAIHSSIAGKYTTIIEEKDTEIVALKKTVEALEQELQQVKKRNKQLCFIMAQAEMKEKSDILLQVDELTRAKDELAEQFMAVTTALEKEKSMVHTLKSEVDKRKGKGGKQ